MIRVDGAWRSCAETQAVFSALAAPGAQVLFVGGCVRNALLGAAVEDIDIATNLRPKDVIALARKAHLAVVPTGIDHGTVTVVSGDVPHEVTTFRADIRTDGRHADVSFSDRIDVDAARRDFTINALYAEPDGTVVDPLGGLRDIQDRRLRFIGNAQDRIREDYLRSLRYFRFFAWYADPGRGLDPDALDAIARNIDGLHQLAKERVTSELLKLLRARDPAVAAAGMQQTGVLSNLLPGADPALLFPLLSLEVELGIGASDIRRLVALMPHGADAVLRLSRAEARSYAQLGQFMTHIAGPAELGFRMGRSMAQDTVLLRNAALSHPISKADWDKIAWGSKQVLPVSAADLMPRFHGPKIGEALEKMTKEWIASDFTLSKSDLINALD